MTEVCKACADGKWLGGGYTLEQCSAAGGNASHFFFKPATGWCGLALSECTPVESKRNPCTGCTGEYGSCESDVAYIFQRTAASSPAQVPAAAEPVPALSAGSASVGQRLLSSQGVLAKATTACSADSNRSEASVDSMAIVQEWRNQFPDSVVQADDGEAGCYIAQSTANPARVLTLVDKTSRNICQEGQMMSRSEPRAFPVEGAMAQRALTRNLFVVSPKEGVCTQTSPCPVVIYLHGHNEHVNTLVASGDQAAVEEAWEKASSSGFMRYAHQQDCSSKLHSVFVFPQLLADEGWTEDGPRVMQEFILPILQRHTNGDVEGFWDTSKVAVLGYSEGAFGAMHAATQHPDVFSLVVAAAPNRPPGAGGANWNLVAPSQETLQKPWLLRTFIATFGEVDEIGASTDALQSMMNELKRTGIANKTDLHARIYMGMGHIHWDELFNQWRALHETLWLGGLEVDRVGEQEELLEFQPEDVNLEGFTQSFAASSQALNLSRNPLLEGWQMTEVCKACADGKWLGGGYTLEQCSAAGGNASHFFFKPATGWCGLALSECTPVESKRNPCTGCTGEYGSCESDVAYIFQRTAASSPAQVPAAAEPVPALSAGSASVGQRLLSSQGVLAKATTACSADSNRSEASVDSMAIVQEWRNQFPDSVVQADDGEAGCYIAQSTANPARVLTLVDKTSRNICQEGQMMSRSEPRAFPVEGAMAQRALTRNLFVVSPKEGVCTQTSPCPVVIYLHGHNEHVNTLVASGDQAAVEEAWEKASSSGFMRYAHQQDCSSKLHSVFVFPQLLADEGWTEDGPRVMQEFILPILQRHTNGDVEGFWDTSKVAVLGYSEGAFGAMHAATQHPDVFSLVVAAAPNRPPGAGGANWNLVAPSQETLQKPWLLRTFIATFGEVDEIGASTDALQSMMNELKRTGIANKTDLHARIYMGMGHIHWDELFNQWRALHETLWLGGLASNVTQVDDSPWRPEPQVLVSRHGFSTKHSISKLLLANATAEDGASASKGMIVIKHGHHHSSRLAVPAKTRSRRVGSSANEVPSERRHYTLPVLPRKVRV